MTVEEVLRMTAVCTKIEISVMCPQPGWDNETVSVAAAEVGSEYLVKFYPMKVLSLSVCISNNRPILEVIV